MWFITFIKVLFHLVHISWAPLVPQIILPSPTYLPHLISRSQALPKIPLSKSILGRVLLCRSIEQAQSCSPCLISPHLDRIPLLPLQQAHFLPLLFSPTQPNVINSPSHHTPTPTAPRLPNAQSPIVNGVILNPANSIPFYHLTLPVTP